MFTLFRRELHLAFAEGANLSVALIFFLCLVIVFTFGLGPDLKLLAQTGPAILWAGPLLSILLGLPHILQADAEDGMLDVYRMSPLPLELITLTKAFAYWLSTAVPLVMVSPFFGLMLAMDPMAIWGCFLCLLVGTPGLVFVGITASALTLTVKRNGMLLIVLATPILVPALIFGVSASVAFADSTKHFLAPFFYLSAFSVFFGLVAALAGGAALRSINTP